MRRTARVAWSAATILTSLITLRATPLACSPFAEAAPPEVMETDAAAESSAGSMDAAPPSCTPAPDLQRDAKNCGRCGRDCGPADCRAGECAAYVIAEDVRAPWYLTVDDTYAYWTSYLSGTEDSIDGDGTVRRTKKLGGGKVEVVATSPSSFALLVVGDFLYFTVIGNGGRGAFRVPKAGGAAAPTAFVGGEAVELAVLGDALFVTVDASTGGAVIAVPAAGGMQRSVVSLPPGKAPEGITADDKDIYWVNHTTPGDVGRVNVVPGGPPDIPWAAGQAAPRRIVADDEAVYWTNSAIPGGGIVRKKKSTPKDEPAERIFAGNVRYGSVVVDAANAYVTVEKDGAVVRIDKHNPSRVTALATNLVDPTGLAQDADAIYFTERGGRHRVYRMRK